MHATYFELFEIDGLLRNKYNTPMEYVQLYGNNAYECGYKIREWALSQEMHSRSFHAIVSELKDDIFRLGKIIVNTKSSYQHRITTAQQLRDVLKYVKSMLTIDHSIRKKQRMLNGSKYNKRHNKKKQAVARLSGRFFY